MEMWDHSARGRSGDGEQGQGAQVAGQKPSRAMSAALEGQSRHEHAESVQGRVYQH